MSHTRRRRALIVGAALGVLLGGPALADDGVDYRFFRPPRLAPAPQFQPSELDLRRERPEPPIMLFTFQKMGLVWHVNEGSMPENYPLKLDPKAHFVYLPGIVITAEVPLDKRFTLRLEASHFYNCTADTSGYIHLGPRMALLSRGNHKILFGIGPTLTWRESWEQYGRVSKPGFYSYSEHNGWEYMFLPFGGDVAYFYRVQKNVELVFSVVPGLPRMVTFRGGVRWGLLPNRKQSVSRIARLAPAGPQRLIGSSHPTRRLP